MLDGTILEDRPVLQRLNAEVQLQQMGDENR
jgi:hypothetical protein